MTLLDSAIANLTKLLDCYSRQCDLANFHKTRLELLAYQDVRDGVPRWKRELGLHHASDRGLYAVYRADVDLLAGKEYRGRDVRSEDVGHVPICRTRRRL